MKKPSVREIIDQNHFDTIYEPIVVVENTQIFGYESLTRLKTDHWMRLVILLKKRNRMVCKKHLSCSRFITQ